VKFLGWKDGYRLDVSVRSRTEEDAEGIGTKSHRTEVHVSVIALNAHYYIAVLKGSVKSFAASCEDEACEVE
jgi:hypothetical protein